MIKQTLYFGNPAYLSLKNKQLLIRLPEVAHNDTLPDTMKKAAETTRAIEDIGVVILDHSRITITHSLMTALLENNVALIHCNDSHHPTGMMLNLEGNSLQTLRFKDQIAASEPLKKQLWQQTVAAKIENQQELLRGIGIDVKPTESMLLNLKSGDPDNYEARAAAYYWSKLFTAYVPSFRREREGEPPNSLLNYGYAILRAAVARSLVGSGLHPTLGIFHSNQYNAYCLADDIMEPYRPFVDREVLACLHDGEDITSLNTSVKSRMLRVLQQDAHYGKERSPLMVGMVRTTASLAACFDGSRRRIVYPNLYAS